MPTEADALAARLDADRRGLLDLTLRNPLLNDRPRGRSLEIVGEAPAELFRLLVREGRSMTFLPDPDARDEPPAPDDPPRPPLVTDPADLKLQTPLAAEPLERRLLALYYAARTSIEEQGVNTLFLALGRLHWAEADAPNRPLRAPLLLVPVELSRSTARERFRLRHDGEDPGANLSLAARMRADAGIDLPPWPDPDELEPAAYFEAVAAAISARPGWSVDRNAAALGFYSFGKFLMYRDLDPDAWPEGARPADHPILRALLGPDGFREPPADIGDDEPLDGRLDPAEAMHVVDADSSQALAVHDAARGRNLVIQGPPGTGKSQTITNLITGAIGRGQSVLFVAEKMAALEVVKRRLDSVGLGDACLELHSHKMSKKAVLAEIRRTLDQGAPRVGAVEEDLALLTERRDRLNAYAEAVNAPIGASGVSPHDAIGELLQLDAEGGPAPLPRPDLPGLESWTASEFRRRLDLVDDLQARLGPVGVPDQHPFRGSRRTSLLPVDADRLRGLIQVATSALDHLQSSAANVAALLTLAPPAGPEGCAALLAASDRALEWPSRSGADLRSADWTARRADLDELIAAGSSLSAIRRRYEAVILAQAWDEPELLCTRRDLNDLGRRWWRFLSGTYRRAMRQLAALCRGVPPASLDDRLALIDAILAARRQREILRRHADLAARLFGDRWQGEATDWPELQQVAAWVAQLRREVQEGQIPAALLELLASRASVDGLDAAVEDLRTALQDYKTSIDHIFEFLQIETCRRSDLFAAFGAIRSTLSHWNDRVDSLRDLAALNHAAEACRREGLAGVVELAAGWPEAAGHLTRAVRRRWFEGLLEAAFRERPGLAGFDGRAHDGLVRAFRDLDRAALGHARAVLARAHWGRLPRHDGGGQLAVLRREFEKKARHLPVRQLVAKAGNAVQAIKPVWMMSPLSVAAYLAPGGVGFDLVVFDEASQVRPVDALGALLRGRQAVVVGDSRQLPPTSFFDRLVAGDEDDDEPTSGDLESILGLFAAQGAPQRLLRWHYRSRHESLIAVSNREFYDGRLVVFPSPDAGRRDSGLVLRHLPDTVYDRGRTRTNPGEAEAVALAVMDHARAQLAREPRARLSLGVAAFSNAQAQAILARLERLRREDPSCEPFLADTHAAEPFFVKNLENVQGDERDVIFISVGYGRSADGAAAMNFGPLNADGGERRLNVLITRARLRCEVFTNLTADDIDLGRSQSRGVAAFKTFLAAAQQVGAEVAARADDAPESAFLAALRNALAAAGHDARLKVGPPGSGLDLAIADPDRPGRLMLGLEADGAGYRDARWARDRDRLRPQVLEGLGWRLHRAWSPDFFRDPAAALRRVEAALDEARRLEPEPVAETPPAPVVRDEPPPEPAQPPEPESTGAPPYQMAELSVDLTGLELHEVPAPRLAGWVAEVVAAEGPVHVDEVARRIAEAAGVKRSGRRIQAALELAVSLAEREGRARRAGDFLWPPDEKNAAARDRSALPAAARKLDLVADEEIAAAIERVVADAFGLEPAAVAPAAARLLGFPRLGDDMRRRIESVRDAMLADRRLAQQGTHVVIPDLRVAG